MMMEGKELKSKHTRLPQKEKKRRRKVKVLSLKSIKTGKT